MAAARGLKLSEWARQQWGGSRAAMCTGGRRVYDAVVALEKKGKTPSQIYNLMKAKSAQATYDYFEQRLGWNQYDTAPDSSRTTRQAIRTLLDMEGLSGVTRAALREELSKLGSKPGQWTLELSRPYVGANIRISRS